MQNRIVCTDCGKILYLHYVNETRLPLPRPAGQTIEHEATARSTIVEKTIEVPVVKIVERTTEVPVERIIERIVEVPIVRRIEVPVERIIEKIVEVPVEKVVEKTIEKIIEVPIEKIVEVPVVKSADDETTDTWEFLDTGSAGGR